MERKVKAGKIIHAILDNYETTGAPRWTSCSRTIPDRSSLHADFIILANWEQDLRSFKARLALLFPRQELRETCGHFLDGLLPGIERKTGWLMAEQAGLGRPYRMQSLLGRSQWNEDGLRDAVRAYVIEALGDTDGVLIVDETGFVKKGTSSLGVARQFSGTAGRIENSQIGVFLAYASRFGQALIDRRLYLPEAWAKDEARRGKAHVPDRSASPPNPRSLAILSKRRLMPASRVLLFWPMRCTGRIRACGACSKNAASPTFWL